MQAPACRSSSSAFTLIELLTVVAIVGVLGAIILAATGDVRESARSTQCLSNLRHIQLANIAYSYEHQGGYVPILAIDKENANLRSFWYQNTAFLDHLVKESANSTTNPAKLAETLQCPTARALGNKLDYTYGTNAHGRGGEWVAGLVRQIRTSDLPNPSVTMAFADGLDWQLFSDGATGYAKEWETRTGPSTHIVAYRHSGQANLVYFDGRASRLGPEGFSSNPAGGVAKLWPNRG